MGASSWKGFGSLLDASWELLREFGKLLGDLLETFWRVWQGPKRRQRKNMKVELPCRRELDSEDSEANRNRHQIDENMFRKFMLGETDCKIASSLRKIDEKSLWRGFLDALGAFCRSPWLLSGTLLERPWPPPALLMRKVLQNRTPSERDILQVLLKIVSPSRRHAKIGTWSLAGARWLGWPAGAVWLGLADWGWPVTAAFI